MQSAIIYLRERFPVLPAVAFGVLFSAVCYLYAHHQSTWESDDTYTLIILSILLFLFLFRLRLWDDIKDRGYDDTHHEDRPIQRGLINPKNLWTTSLLVLLIEFALQIVFTPIISIIFACTVFYSYLMFKEFFIPKILHKSLLLYMISHQIIFLLYIIYCMSAARGALFIPTSWQDFWVVVALFLFPMIYEVGRKARHRTDTNGTITDDTYIYAWGPRKTLLFLLMLFACEYYALLVFITTHNLLTILALASGPILLLLSILIPKKVLFYAPLWSTPLGILILFTLATLFL